MVDDIITVTAFMCTHCKGLFRDEDSALIHLRFCPYLAAYKKEPVEKKYIVDSSFGNMILKEGK